MTAREWSECRMLTPMLSFARFREWTDRKRRLFACACCRSVWDLLVDPASRTAVERAERFADAESEAELERLDIELELAHKAAKAAAGAWNDPRNAAAHAAVCASDTDPCANLYPEATSCYAAAARGYVEGQGWEIGPGDVLDTDSFPDFRDVQCEIVRELVGDPFTPLSFGPSRLAEGNGTLKLANAIRMDTDFRRLPLLADALEVAGCRDAAILGHCRGVVQHLRGCWVIDLLLGNE